MNTEQIKKIMADEKKRIIQYMEDQLDVEIEALKTYEDDGLPIGETDVEIKKIRESEATKIRHHIYELKKHIAVIKRM